MFYYFSSFSSLNLPLLFFNHSCARALSRTHTQTHTCLFWQNKDLSCLHVWHRNLGQIITGPWNWVWGNDWIPKPWKDRKSQDKKGAFWFWEIVIFKVKQWKIPPLPFALILTVCVVLKTACCLFYRSILGSSLSGISGLSSSSKVIDCHRCCIWLDMYHI